MKWEKKVQKDFYKKTRKLSLRYFRTSCPPDQRILFLYAITEVQMLYAEKWKERTILTKGEWQMKLMEQVELANLTNIIIEQEEGDIKEEWKMFVKYLKNHGKLTKLLTGVNTAVYMNK